MQRFLLSLNLQLPQFQFNGETKYRSRLTVEVLAHQVHLQSPWAVIPPQALVSGPYFKSHQPLSSFHFLPLPSFSFHTPFPQNPAKQSGERCKLPQWGPNSKVESQLELHFYAFWILKTHLMATFLAFMCSLNDRVLFICQVKNILFNFPSALSRKHRLLPLVNGVDSTGSHQVTTWPTTIRLTGNSQGLRQHHSLASICCLVV